MTVDIALQEQLKALDIQILELLNQRARVIAQLPPCSAGQWDSYIVELQQTNTGTLSNEAVKRIWQSLNSNMVNTDDSERAHYLYEKSPNKWRTVVNLPNSASIGAGDFQIIAGPCAVESYEQLDAMAQVLSSYGVKILRGMAFKPRTSPYDFQGLGEEGLAIARQVADKYNMVLVSEILDASQIPMMYDYVDIFWVGSRNMHNSFLLRAVGEIDKPVILKRGFGATMKEWLMASEYILLGGNEDVILIERGIRTFNDWTRATLDISAVPLVKQHSHLPIVVDISHSAGRPDIATGLTAAAIASGADGLMVEVHPNPKQALSDAQQQLTPEQFADVVQTVARFQREPIAQL